MYRQVVESLGHKVHVASGGVQCIALLEEQNPDVIVLEAPLFWGGADGVLQNVQQNSRLGAIPVILVAAGTGTIDWLCLSRFRIDNLLFRVPTAQELAEAIARVKLHPESPLLKAASQSSEVALA